MKVEHRWWCNSEIVAMACASLLVACSAGPGAGPEGPSSDDGLRRPDGRTCPEYEDLGRSSDALVIEGDDRILAGDAASRFSDIGRYSTALITPHNNINSVCSGDGVRLDRRPLVDSGSNQPLCADEAFADVPVVNDVCSGTLVDGDLMLTAGHCVQDQARCEALSVIFNYRVDDGAPTRIDPEAHVYRCAELVARGFAGGRMSIGGRLEQPYLAHEDWALIRLDRPARAPLRPASIAGLDPADPCADVDSEHDGYELSPGIALEVVGHPQGLPSLITHSEVHDVPVRDIGRCQPFEGAPSDRFDVFNYDGDTANGNSGSGLFDEHGQLVAVHFSAWNTPPASASDFSFDEAAGCSRWRTVGDRNDAGAVAAHVGFIIDRICEQGVRSRLCRPGDEVSTAPPRTATPSEVPAFCDVAEPTCDPSVACTDSFGDPVCPGQQIFALCAAPPRAGIVMEASCWCGAGGPEGCGECVPLWNGDTVFSDLPSDAVSFGDALNLYRFGGLDGEGTAPIAFRPDDVVTRGEFGEMVAARLVDRGIDVAGVRYDDVDPGTPRGAAIQRAAAAGFFELIERRPDSVEADPGSLGVDLPVTREEAYASIAYAMDLLIADADVLAQYYADAADVAFDLEEPVASAHAQGIVFGTPRLLGGTVDMCGRYALRPGDAMTRAEAAAAVRAAFNQR